MNKRIEIVEVCPRDGFQSIKEFIPTEIKIKVINKLIEAGFGRVEIASFISPKAIPQMADAAEVVANVKKENADKNLKFLALVANEKGVQRAVEAGVDQITYAISLSERHNLANVNRTIEESKAQYEQMIKKYKEVIDFRLGLSAVYGSPFEDEEIPLDNILRMCEWALNNGTVEILLADTVGVGDPVGVKKVTEAIVKEFGTDHMIGHLHNTRGLALPNTMVALDCGIHKFESAAAGMGGCPFAKGAAGNVSTEDLNHMLTKLGYETGVDMKKLGEALRIIENDAKIKPDSYLSRLI